MSRHNLSTTFSRFPTTGERNAASHFVKDNRQTGLLGEDVISSFFFRENKHLLDNYFQGTAFAYNNVSIFNFAQVVQNRCIWNIFLSLVFCFHSSSTSFTCSFPPGPIYTSKTYFQRTISLSIAWPPAVKALLTYTSLTRENFFA